MITLRDKIQKFEDNLAGVKNKRGFSLAIKAYSSSHKFLLLNQFLWKSMYSKR